MVYPNVKNVGEAFNALAMQLNRYSVIGLGIIALCLRLWGIDFGLPYLYHPDEVNKITIAQNIFKTGDLNPHYFSKPTLFIYLNAAAYVAVLPHWKGVRLD